MTEREKEILRMAVIYLAANLDDAIMEAFEFKPFTDRQQLLVNGEAMDVPTEDELDQLMEVLQ
jgi:hypothetical protein